MVCKGVIPFLDAFWIVTLFVYPPGSSKILLGASASWLENVEVDSPSCCTIVVFKRQYSSCLGGFEQRIPGNHGEA